MRSFPCCGLAGYLARGRAQGAGRTAPAPSPGRHRAQDRLPDRGGSSLCPVLSSPYAPPPVVAQWIPTTAIGRGTAVGPGWRRPAWRSVTVTSMPMEPGGTGQLLREVVPSRSAPIPSGRRQDQLRAVRKTEDQRRYCRVSRRRALRYPPVRHCRGRGACRGRG